MEFAMKQFEWSDDYLVAEEAIDVQHRQLFALANDLIQSENQAQLQENVMRLYRHCREHFEAEETFMKNSAYPLTQAHTASHNLMLDKLVEASQIIQRGAWQQNDTLNFMHDWIQHVQTEDRAIGEYFRDKGLKLEA
ncbi:hypothetical protein A1507_10005 [Methylomonas koyamae]|uniref:Hemerythrin-like domain-containing protein n=2 Tax=Methylomonas koyamae TaxID=702114 RepID=A0A177NM09_9GAMM|nr:hypothetical protein A1507_10005 [Methylomonas koyamae]